VRSKGNELRVAVIGVGIMGRPIAEMLLRTGGHEVVVFNRSQARMAPLAKAGATIGRSVTDSASGADVILTVLPTLSASDEVYQELVCVATPNQLYIEHSTISPELARRVASAIKATGAGYLDAPVSGGPEGVLNRTLTVFAGGDASTYERSLDLLRCYAANVRLCGPTGAGMSMKLVSQLLVTANAVAAAEAMLLGEHLGLSLALIWEMMKTSAGGSRMLDRNIPRVLESRYQDPLRGPIRLTLKDDEIVLDVAARLKLELRVFRSAYGRLRQAEHRGLAEHDLASVSQSLQDDDSPFA
jgi:3-hydroxyisobutyrate dehydrogenase-like beta-hydroxyacid dehydrogenase